MKTRTVHGRSLLRMLFRYLTQLHILVGQVALYYDVLVGQVAIYYDVYRNKWSIVRSDCSRCTP